MTLGDLLAFLVIAGFFTALAVVHVRENILPTFGEDLRALARTVDRVRAEHARTK